jgi:hypothetical protein
MTTAQKVLGGLGAALIVAFFLPWIALDLGFVQASASGGALPGRLRSLLGVTESLGAAGSHSSGSDFWLLLLYLLYLIPLGGGRLVYLAWVRAQGGHVLRGAALLGGAVTVALTLYCLVVMRSQLGPGSTQLLASGFWLSLLLGVGLLIMAVWLPRSAAATGRPLLSPAQQAQIQARGRQALGQASDWMRARRQQLDTGAEQHRIQGALGRRVNRAILDAQDAVLAPAGTLITHDLIERARQAGVLPALLSSVDRAQSTSQPG